MGRYDVAATLTYILKETEEDELSFVGHSLGCTLFYIAMIEQPELNAKVDVMISLAPTTSAAHLNNLFRYLAPMVQPMKVDLIIFFLHVNKISKEVDTIHDRNNST